jgi:Ca-activated chloride channel homolog
MWRRDTGSVVNHWRALMNALKPALQRMCAAALLVGMPFLAATPAGAEDGALNESALKESAQSPYFAVDIDSGLDQFPMKETRVTARLNGVIASVHVRQRYRNEGTTPINAKYIFPGSTRAAVNAMTMSIGDRRLVAKIKEKEQARQIFNAAKAAGQTASLLSQKRPNVFSMDVANIAVGTDVVVEMDYTEFLTANEGVYEFMYPGVVGPRYGGDAGAAAISNPYLKKEQNKDSSGRATFNISVELASPIAVHDLQSPTHQVTTRWTGATAATVNLNESLQTAGNRDYVLHYRLQDNAIVSGITRFSSGADSYFMLQAEPPKRVSRAELPARDYVFIVDISGSMDGFPLNTAKVLIEKLLAGLQSRDSFNILFFAGGSQVLAPQSLPATPENIALAMQMLARMSGGGGTELLPALRQALAMPVAEGTSRSMVVITDGYITAEGAAFRIVDENLGNSNLFAFGIGSSVNRFLIEGLAKVGRAEAFVVSSEMDAAREAERFRNYISAPVLTDIKVSGTGVELYDTEPVAQPDLLAERPVLVLGKYRNAKAGASIELTGVSGAGAQSWKFALGNADKDRSLPLLWARKRLERLYVFPNAAEDSRQEILALGLKYSLLTSATSFIAVDEVVSNPTKLATDVKQPLPLPAGVSNSAVGSELQPAPEPEWLLLGLWCSMLLVLRQLSRRFARA